MEVPPAKGVEPIAPNATPRQKGQYGEKISHKYYKSLGYKRLDEPLDVNANGIDAIYVTKEGKYVIVETKFSSSGRASLGKTLDGQQMSDSWLKGGSSRNRGSRIHEAVKHLRDENLAKKIEDALDRGEVQKVVAVVGPDGSISLRDVL